MNMTAELVQRMKAAAQEATQGEWRWEGEGGFSYLLAEGDTSPEHRIIDDGSAWGEYAETISPDSFDAAHIATSCPQNVLALVEALEAAEKRGTDMEVACELFAESKLAQIKLEAALGKAQQRIAELERMESALRPVGVMSQKAYRRLENRESRFIALWPRPEIYLPRKRPDDGVIVFARTAACVAVEGE
ncbi:ead/Ea22-like family protein [Escherichia coli]|uniref:ead/Ea22-like family protein n=1 Tax=Escherichia coli TaxID=562 RepID=UPI002FF2CA38